MANQLDASGQLLDIFVPLPEQLVKDEENCKVRLERAGKLLEGLGAEVSAKIRSAIKAKLIELEAYVDEELPDYIMVMVANNRNKEQMEDDLGLFLNNNTKAFICTSNSGKK